MPSAVTKPDNKTSPEVSNTISSAIDAVEKKCRNLVKKKGRLEQYREKAASGGVLNADQLKAVGGYDGIIANIEFASELTKLFASMQVEAEKLSVKQLKREAYERQQSELKRLRAVLDLQNLLDSLGPDEVRADLKAGAHGLPVLTEDNITQLDEFYTLINPTRDGETSYPDQLSAAAEHVTAYLEARDKAVVGTTYKAIREMADKISESGYLDRTPEEPTEEEEVVVEEAEDEVVDEQVLVQEEEPCEQQLEPEVVVVEAAVPEYTPAVAELPEAVPESVPADYGVRMVAPVEQEAAETEGETFLDTQAGRQAPRPFNEIVSSVQGNFNFLQDSEIESNPAAVAPAEAVHLESAPAAAVTHYGVPDTQAFQEAAAAPQYVAPELADSHATYEPTAVEPAYSEQAMYAAQNLMPSQSYDQLSDESKKEYTMNPNAEIFNSVYTQAPGTDAVTAEPTYQQAATAQQAPAQPPANAWANTPDFSHTAQSTYGYGAAAAPPRRGGSAGPQGGSSQQGGGQRSNYRGGQQGGQRQGTNGYRGGQSGGGQRNGGGQGYGGQRGQQGMSGQRGGGQGYRGRDYQDQGYQGSQGSYNQGYQGGNRGGRGGNGGRGGGRGGYGGGGRMGRGSNQ